MRYLSLGCLRTVYSPLSRKAVGKDGPDVDPGPSLRGKRKADSDGGEEVFAKKSQLISTNELK